MIAYITSIGEPTTDLCEWALQRNGFETHLVYNETSSLADKLEYIYNQADTDFIRVDADFIVNKNCTSENMTTTDEVWWVQFQMFDWFQQNVGYGGVQFYKREALPYLRKRVKESLDKNRPETFLSRIPEFHNPRRFVSSDTIMGLHNYKNDIKRVAKVKANRGQSAHYDFELAQRLNEL